MTVRMPATQRAEVLVRGATRSSPVGSGTSGRSSVVGVAVRAGIAADGAALCPSDSTGAGGMPVVRVAATTARATTLAAASPATTSRPREREPVGGGGGRDGAALA